MARKNNRNFKNANKNEIRDGVKNNRHEFQDSFKEAAKPSLKERVAKKFQGKAKSFLLGAAYVGVTWIASSLLEAITDEYQKMDDK